MPNAWSHAEAQGEVGPGNLVGMAGRSDWTRDELLVVFRFYCRTPFGQLYARRREVIELAERLGRTPGSVAMKARNFASLDPAQQARGIRGLSGVSAADRRIWEEFAANSEALAVAAEEAYARFAPAQAAEQELQIPDGPTEVMRTVRARRVQGFFAAAVAASYENRCALTGLGVRELLSASHIIAWSVDERRRADPRNGILLNALHARAFDRGLIAFDDDLRVLISPRLKCERMERYRREMAEEVEGRELRLPVWLRPDMEAVRGQRERFGGE